MIDQSIKVRTGTPADIDDVMRIAIAACEDNALCPPNPEKLLRDIWPALNLDKGIMGVIGSPIEAAILLRIENLWYSDELMMIERSIFVDPTFRSAKGGRAKLLCEYAKVAAKELGLKLIIGIISNERTEGKIRLYHRAFGEPSGAYWVWGGQTGLKAVSP